MSGENEAENGQQQKGGEGGKEFAPITSQEQLNRLIGERINAVKSQFADYDDLKTKAAEYDKVTEASKTELQKAIERAEAAEQRAQAFEAREQRTKWAEEIVKGSDIPAAALRGATREELAEHFEVLKGLVKPPRRTATPPGRPAQDSEKGRAAAALRELRRGT